MNGKVSIIGGTLQNHIGHSRSPGYYLPALISTVNSDRLLLSSYFAYYIVGKYGILYAAKL